MKKGKSTYTFQLNCDPKLINDLIQSYIQGAQYELQQENGEKFYRAGDAMIEGYRYFNYSISGPTLTIYAWFKGIFGEVPIEQNSLNVTALSYRKSLGTLFQEINKLNKGEAEMNNNMNNNMNNDMNNNMNNNMNPDIDTNAAANTNTNANMNFDPNTGQPINQNDMNQFTEIFQNQTTAKQEKMCEAGFWLSLVGLLLSFVGVGGLLLYILNCCFASQGLKTRKRSKAIATIVITIASLFIIFIQILLMPSNI